MTYTIKELRDKNLIIFETVAGSHAYGTATPESDRDIRGVFVQPLNDVLKYGFVEQVADETNDVVFYELGRFMHLVAGNNPNILELLAMPEDCVIFCDPKFKELMDARQSFLTKKVKYTFAGYAIEQIRKARGYNKKMNWEEKEMTRKTVLDFCYVLQNDGSVPVKDWIDRYNAYEGTFKSYKDYALSAIDHAHDVYSMFYLPNTGIVSDPEKANEIQLTSIPKGTILEAYLTFNKDGYSSHCSKYKEYQTWLKERNVNRFKMNKAHGKNYDSKNMMHTYRLLSMAHELAKGELRVRRTEEERAKLMKIRLGEYEYEDLLKEAEAMITGLDAAFEASTLPDKVYMPYVEEILFNMRTHYYKV
jgi:predicted nucleotidyltransferase